MSNSKPNFYEILKATSTASFNELKSNYKQLILQCHPDKLQQQLDVESNNSQILVNDDPSNLEFIAITEAWSCLKDPVKRKQYDAELLLNKFHTHNNIYAHIKLSEMKKQPNTGEYYEKAEEEEVEKLETKESGEDDERKYLYTYNCRCGGQYIVDESAEQYCRSGNNHDAQTDSDSDNNGVQNDHNGDDDHDDDDAKNKSVSGSTTQNNKSSPNVFKCKNYGGGGGIGAGGGSEGVVRDKDNDGDDDIDEEEVGGELIVECSECSLVIILNG